MLDADIRKYAAEAIGTMVLMLIGPGTAILAADAMGTVGIALAFGFALTIMAYTIGHVSGCHINPAVTLSFLLAKKIDNMTAAFYMIAQVIGAIVGGLLLYLVTEGGDLDKTGVFASNGWGDTLGVPFGLGSVIVVEILFTAILTFVVLGTTSEGYPSGFGGIAAGVALAGIHLATIPVDNTSVNPARSIGAALFAGTDHLQQVWAFIVFPLVGGAVGWAAHNLLHGNKVPPPT
ncbi:MAG: aquaporin [Acidimicrobiaceae bacterium]|nr:aquaporin [Acidimicrobiaceae bacterium]